MATILLMSHPVKDYDSWKKGFDSHEPERAKNGFELLYIGRDATDRNRVRGAFRVPSAEAAHGFLNNPELKAAMEAAGVTGPVEAHIVETA